MKHVLITGANGFVGRHLCAHLSRAGWGVSAVVRSGASTSEIARYATVHPVSEVTSGTQWDPLLANVDAVVHLAARVHVMAQASPHADAEYKRDNADATAALAAAAARCGIADFVFTSSVKVHGESTLDRPFSESDTPRPLDPYARSKWEAECRLSDIANSSSMAVTVLRLPVVYGAGVKGNFLRLMNLVVRSLPLPLASVLNSRSLLYVGNLVDAIEKRLATPASGTDTFLISDSRDLSTPQLILSLAAALRVKPRLLPCPVPALRVLATVAGKRGEISRMVESLTVDCSKLQTRLHWSAPYTPEEGFEATARWFLGRTD